MLKPWPYSCLLRKIYFCSHRRNLLRLILLVVCGLLLYNEYLVYFINSLSWPQMKCGDIQKLHRVLLVADPQILGEKAEPWLARWDNDRYLKQSFATVLNHVRPELVVFLGDLMDEGSLASDDEYKRYYLRFRDIFQLDYIPTNQTVFIPGDNDIGGEDELVTDNKVNRFKQFFPSPTVYYLGSIQFVQVDKMQRVVPTVAPLISNDNRTRVVITHMPLLGMPSAFAAEVLQKLRPHAILSAHDHKSVHFSAHIETGERLLVETMVDNQHAGLAPTWRFQRPDHIVNEVMVPTCSYRMGVANMGYGVALLDRRGEAWCYHVLWLPSRFYAILSYLCVIGLILVTLVVGQVFIASCRPRHRLSPEFRKL